MSRADSRSPRCVSVWSRKIDVPPRLGDADFEGDARAQRGLLENQREDVSRERGAMAVGMSLNLRSQMEEVRAAARDSTPFR